MVLEFALFLLDFWAEPLFLLLFVESLARPAAFRALPCLALALPCCRWVVFVALSVCFVDEALDFGAPPRIVFLDFFLEFGREAVNLVLELLIRLGNLFADKVACKFFSLVRIFQIHGDVSGSGFGHAEVNEFLDFNLATLVLFYFEMFIPITNKEGFEKVFKGVYAWMNDSVPIAWTSSASSVADLNAGKKLLISVPECLRIVAWWAWMVCKKRIREMRGLRVGVFMAKAMPSAPTAAQNVLTSAL
jgi:hypothetical protein